MNSSFDRERLIELVGLLCDEIINDQQFDELERILQSSPEARQLYHVYTTMACNLQAEGWNRSGRTDPSCDSLMVEPRIDSSTEKLSVPFAKPTRRFPRVTTGGSSLTGVNAIKWMLAAFLFGGVVWFGVLQFDNPRQDPANHPYAHVLGAVNVVWEQPDNQCSVGEMVRSRRLMIRRGVLHVRFSTCANVAIEGPADFEVINENAAYLHKGQVAVYVPEGAEGFRVDTPQAEVIDLGTEFGLRVDTFGESQVHVFAGEVEYSARSKSAEKTIFTAGLAVAVDGNGISRPVELKERSFEIPREVLWTRFRYATSISSQFIAGNTTEIPGGVPGRIGGGWTSQWVFECVDGEIDTEQTHVRNENPLGTGLENHLDVIAKNPAGGKFTLKMHRGFESIGDKFDCRENYVVQFLIRINSDVSKIKRIKVSDSSFDETVSKHSWRLLANRSTSGSEPGQLKWRGLPLASSSETIELVQREWSRPDPLPTKTKSNRRVVSGDVYRVVAEVQPNKNRYRISLSDGAKTLVGDWTKEISRATTGDRLERRLQWLFEAEDEISVSLDSIRIQNDTVFE